MNEQSKATIERARALLAAANAGRDSVDVTCEGPDAADVSALLQAAPELLAALCDEADALKAERDKLVVDLAKSDGALAGWHDRASIEAHRAAGVIAHLQARNDRLVEENAALRSGVAEAGLCRELIAERDARRAERDQLRKDWDNALSVSTAHFQSEIRALKAEISTEHAKVRRLEGRKARMCACYDPDGYGCVICGGSGAVIVEGET